MSSGIKTKSALHDRKMVLRAFWDAFLKLAPSAMLAEKSGNVSWYLCRRFMTTVLAS